MTVLSRSKIDRRLATSDEYFYAAGWFYDTDTSGIRINSLYRDRWNGDDAFAVVYNEGLDTDRAGQYEFTQPRSLSRALIVKYTHTLGF